MLAGIAALAAFTIAVKGAAAVLPRVPDSVVRRTSGLAPALLAALVVTELLGDDGLPQFDAKLAGVATATALAAVRAPLAVCVIAGAAVAALLRRFGIA